MEAAPTAGRVRRRWVAALVIVLVVIVGAGALTLAFGRSDDNPTSTLAPAHDGVIDLPGFPPRHSPATAVLDGSLFVFGGSAPGSTQFRNDGVLVAQDLRSARRLPDAPFDPPLYNPNAVGTNGQVIVIGVRCDIVDHRDNDSDEPPCVPGTSAAAVLDARDDVMEWRAVKLPEPLARLRMDSGVALGATSDGRAIFKFGQHQQTTFWSFDPRRDAWRQIESPGVGLVDSCLSGDTLVALYGDLHAFPVIASRNLTAAEPWRHSTPAEVVVPDSGPDLACITDGAALIAPAPTAPIRIYSLRDRAWSSPPPPPSRGYFADRVWTGSELVFLPTDADVGQPGLGYIPSTGSWRMLPGAPPVTFDARWNGAAIVGYFPPPRLDPSNAGVFHYVLPAAS